MYSPTLHPLPLTFMYPIVSPLARLKLPRPYTTIVTHIEQHYAAEFGMPSTHATNSVVMPWFVVRAEALRSASRAGSCG
jgi:hypothetical protein